MSSIANSLNSSKNSLASYSRINLSKVKGDHGQGDHEQGESGPKSREAAQESPYDSASLISKYWLAYFWPTLLLARSRTLNIEDVPKVPKVNQSRGLAKKLQLNYDSQIGRRAQPSFMRAILSTFGIHVLISMLIDFVNKCILSTLQIIALGWIIRDAGLYIQSLQIINLEQRISEQSIIFSSLINNVLIVLSCSWLITLSTHPSFFNTNHTALQCRVASGALIYRKALRLSQSAFSISGKGQMVNLLSNDVNRFDESVQSSTNLISAPIQSIVILFILANSYLGIWATLATLLAVLFFLFIQTVIGRGFAKFRRNTAQGTDRRVKILNELIVAIRIIKLYAWEEPYKRLVGQARANELKLVAKSSSLKALNQTMFFSASKLLVFISLITFTSIGFNLDPDVTFVTIGMSNLLRLSLTNLLPQAIANGAETLVTCSRIGAFLQLRERRQSRAHYRRDKDAIDLGALEFEQVHSNWACPDQGELDEDDEEAEFDDSVCVLKSVDFTLEPGQLLMIVGRVGSGKSSLLQSVLGELPVSRGRIRIAGKLSYCSQESWIFSGTVRENILFGSQMIASRYEQVLECCCLNRDLQVLPNGDETLVGERGVTLSGGQKARVSLARALYQEANIYLLDDPLSAVDAPIARDIFSRAIETFLNEKTVLLATHQLQFASKADRLLVMRSGKSPAFGTWSQLRASLDQDDLDMSNYMSSDSDKTSSRASRNDEQEPPSPSKDAKKDASKKAASKSGPEKDNGAIRINIGAQTKGGSETLTHTVVDIDSYLYYLRSASNWFGAFIFTTISVVSQAVFVYNDVFLSLWTDAVQRKDYQGDNYVALNYVDSLGYGSLTAIYSGIVLLLFILTISRSFIFYCGSLAASRHIHAKFVSSIISTNMRFFDFTPIGIFLNRVSRDIGFIDEALPQTLIMLTTIIVTVGGALILSIIIEPINAIPSILLLVIAMLFRNLCSYAIIRTKQIEGAARTPVFSHLSVSLDGLSTIRALGVESDFIRRYDKFQDDHSAAWFLYICSSRTLSFAIELTTLLFITFVIAYKILVDIDSTNAATIGLLITSILWLPAPIQWGVRQLVELESQMTSVQRIREYSNLEPEPDCPPEVALSLRPRKAPQIDFKDLTLKYFEDEGAVLKGLTFSIKAGEKLGVVGRTGAGKSSLIATLFRLYPYEGTISLDGIDTSRVRLRDLRSCLSIIPQDPVLFGGDLRQNLDPFNQHSDGDLWSALDAVQLRHVFADSGGLDFKVQASGSNLSVGQRQLICLARAIVRRNKVLVLDEATANVDPETDSFIQRTIREQFGQCTVLTIAHRLLTIVDSDRILVLEGGEVREFDSPAILASRPDSIFSSMIDSNEPQQAAHLRSLIESSAEAKAQPE